MGADVLIVGAGPVGLALAIGLRLQGLQVRLVDRKLGPSQEPRAAVIWPRGAEVLDDLGLGDVVREAANTLSVLHFHSRGCEIGVARLGGLQSRFPCPLLIEQHVTEHLLIARLAALGVSVEWGTQVTDLHSARDEVTIAMRKADEGGTRARAPWVVGCDGVHSAVRERLGISFIGGTTANLQLQQVDAVPCWRFPHDPGHGRYFLAPGASLGCFPVAEGAYRFFCYTKDTHPECRGAPSAEEMRALIAYVACTPELQLKQVTWLSRTRFQTRQAARLRAGRVLLAGDAAHVWPSLGGHGMSVGLRGAHNLAWKLAAVQRGEAREELLDTYEVEERHAVASFLRLMPYNFVEQPSGSGGVRPREWLLRLGLSVPGLVTRFERALSDLDAHHPSSLLSGSRKGVAARRLSPLRAGRRLPDIEITVDGATTRLHALLGYAHWTLLISNSLSAAAQEALRSSLVPWGERIRLVSVAFRQTVRPRIMADGLIMLVRPDRHVGLIVAHNDIPRLRGYLTRWLGPIGENHTRHTDACSRSNGLIQPPQRRY